jgi:hypothetical protein
VRALARTLTKSTWAFPLALLIPLGILTALEIHGSSIGMYDRYFYGSNHDDPDLLYGEPQAIRSDEWLVTTPYTVSQARNGFPRINPDIGYGQDMSATPANVPYREWSIFFKPSNLAFFFLPLENAFAFQWWITAYLLIVSCYLLVLELVPRQRGFAVLLSISLFLSPFVHWWYSASTLLSLALPLFALVVYIRLLRVERPVHRVGLALLLSYILTCFVLIMYPPFQIACGVATAFVAVGFLMEHIKEKGLRQALRPLVYIGGGILLAGVVTLVFFVTRLEIIRTIVNTAYPGARITNGGDYEALFLFSTHLLPLVQSSSRASQYFSNQSEVSNFFYFAPFLIIPSVYLLFRDIRRSGTTDFPLLFVTVGITLVTLRVLIPGGNWFYRMFLLDKVPGARLLVGLGLLGFLQLVLLFRRYISGNWASSRTVTWGAGIATLSTFLFAGFQIKERFPGFISNPFLITGLSAVISSIVLLYLKGYFRLATLILLVFSVASVFRIHPIYRGLDPLINTNIGRQLRSIGDGDGAWVVIHDLVLEHQPMQQGLQSFSGVYAYPQLSIWRGLDPEADEAEVYNRYGHVSFSTELTSFELFQPDHFGVPFDGCSRFVHENRIRFVLSSTQVSDDCLTLERIVRYPAVDVFIYTVN